MKQFILNSWNFSNPFTLIKCSSTGLNQWISRNLNLASILTLSLLLAIPAIGMLYMYLRLDWLHPVNLVICLLLCSLWAFAFKTINRIPDPIEGSVMAVVVLIFTGLIVLPIVGCTVYESCSQWLSFILDINAPLTIHSLATAAIQIIFTSAVAVFVWESCN